MSRGFTEPDVGVIGFPIALHYDRFNVDRQVVGHFFMIYRLHELNAFFAVR